MFGITPPRNVIYFDNASVSLTDMPYTDAIFAFLVPDDNGNVQAVDAANEPDPRANIETLHSAGKNVLVSFGGATPTSSQYQQCAQNVSNVVQQIVSFVIENGFDGVDIDFEDSSAFTSKALYSGVQFLVDLTNRLAQALPSGQNIITHAPQTPYWDPAGRYNNAYSQIWAEVGDQITWINNQFYNNANYDATASDKLAWYQNIAAITGPEKLLVGATLNPTTEGFIEIDDMINNVITPLQAIFDSQPNVFGGMMGWQFANDSEFQNGIWGSQIEEALGITNLSVSNSNSGRGWGLK